MGARKRQRADRAGRLPMRSPGRPPVGRREHRNCVGTPRPVVATCSIEPQLPSGTPTGVPDVRRQIMLAEWIPSSTTSSSGVACHVPPQDGQPVTHGFSASLGRPGSDGLFRYAATPDSTRGRESRPGPIPAYDCVSATHRPTRPPLPRLRHFCLLQPWLPDLRPAPGFGRPR